MCQEIIWCDRLEVGVLLTINMPCLILSDVSIIFIHQKCIPQHTMHLLPLFSVLQVMPPQRLPGSPTLKEKGWSLSSPGSCSSAPPLSPVSLSCLPSSPDHTKHTWPCYPCHSLPLGLFILSHLSPTDPPLKLHHPSSLNFIPATQTFFPAGPCPRHRAILHPLAARRAPWLQEVMPQR